MGTRLVARSAAMVCLLLLTVSCPRPEKAWRSSLYPQDWAPGYHDGVGRFLHDFSYAGYHSGEEPLPDLPSAPQYAVDAYGADPTGNGDSTAAVQAAINAASVGGGIVYFGAGAYRFDGQLVVAASNVVLRGAGPGVSKLYFTKTEDMAYRAHLAFRGAVQRDPDLPLAEDGENASTQVVVADAASLAPGDEVAVGWTITDAFVAEHGMTGTWKVSNGQWRAFFRRTVASVNTSTAPHTVVLDAPLRYVAKVRDGASIRKEHGYLRECGVEQLSLSNAVDWNAAWDRYQVQLLEFQDAADCWVSHVTSFAAPDPVAEGYHLQNCGILMTDCKRSTIADCRLEKAQNRGTGGCGYLFSISRANDILIRDCVGLNGRHNFIQNWDFGTTGCVFLRCRSAGGRNVLARQDPVGVPAYSEYHHSLAMACLVDQCTLDDGWYGGNRRDESSGAGHTVTESVYWNTSGKGVLLSWQYGWGYVIGTRDLSVVTGLTALADIFGGAAGGTTPQDWVEGIDKGASLQPASLYEDQLARRTAAGKAEPRR